MKKHQTGFTLIELLLVMVIISIIIFASISYVQQQAESTRIARASAQMQQILNAGLSYYVDNGKWPATIDTDLKGKYLPSTTLNNPWGQIYQIYSYPTTNASNPRLLYVYTTIPVANSTSASAAAAAKAIAGLLPFGYVTASTATPPAVGTCTTGNCKVVASVNIPGQNLNNATAINFAGVYHPGACVPVPSCPVDNNGTQMTPRIIVVPIQISGVYENDVLDVFPISSFTAYATSNRGALSPTNKTPPKCEGSTVTPVCTTNAVNDASATAYWRVCLHVVTEPGPLNWPGRTDAWGRYSSLMAVTRCAINNEPSGSNFQVYGN
ncbi:MAG: prepilin-type N-terminal cleavage/methylation domain-containing protein [Gammaproteobacteria bacterium]|nr:prepilin-type N-terminal cleavage/methylation domain-containing protein [Gammaproteobacteria bacterium]